MANSKSIYPRTGDTQTVYLKNVITRPNIEVGDYTMYNDFVNDPKKFEQNNVLYQYPINHDRLIIGKFCSIACGAKFLFNSANHTMASLSTYPFPFFLRNGSLRKRMLPRHGIIREILLSAMMSGLVMKRLFWQVLRLEMEQLSVLVLLSPKMCRHIALWAVYLQNLLENDLMMKQS